MFFSARQQFPIVQFGIFYHADTNSKQQKRRIKNLNTCIGLFGAVFPSVHHSSFVRLTSYSFIGHSTSLCFFLSSLFARPQIVGQHHLPKRKTFRILVTFVSGRLLFSQRYLRFLDGFYLPPKIRERIMRVA